MQCMPEKCFFCKFCHLFPPLITVLNHCSLGSTAPLHSSVHGMLTVSVLVLVCLRAESTQLCAFVRRLRKFDLAALTASPNFLRSAHAAIRRSPLFWAPKTSAHVVILYCNSGLRRDFWNLLKGDVTCSILLFQQLRDDDDKMMMMELILSLFNEGMRVRADTPR